MERRRQARLVRRPQAESKPNRVFAFEACLSALSALSFVDSQREGGAGWCYGSEAPPLPDAAFRPL